MNDTEEKDGQSSPKKESRFTAENREKKIEFRLDGTAVTISGKLTKTKYFEFLEVPLDDYSDLKYTPAEVARIRSHIMNMRTGLQAMAPMFCFEGSAEITLSDGTIKPIKDIQIGDYVLSGKGISRKIINKFERKYTGAMFSFQYSQGSGSWTSWMTHNHNLYIKRSNSSIIQKIEAADIQRGDYIVHTRLPLFNNISSEKDLVLASLLGYYLAEGHIYINNGYELGFSFHRDEIQYQQEVIEGLKLLGYNPKIIISKKSKAMQIRVTRKEAVDLFIRLGGKSAKNKKIAEEVFSWNQDAIYIMLRSYINGNGCYRAKRQNLKRKWSPEIHWKTISKNLADQIHLLMIAIGLKPNGPFKNLPSINRYAKTRQDIYVGYLRNESVDAFIEKDSFKSNNKFIVNNNYLFCKIIDIKTKSISNEFVYNITVEKDHSYLNRTVYSSNCGGPMKCPVIFRCPFRQQHELKREEMDPKKFPIGRQCIIEREFLLHKRREYFEEYTVNPDSPTEIGLVNKLAELDMYEYRATLMLAHGDSGLGGSGQDILKEQTIAMTPQGHELKRVEIHPAWELKEKIHKQRMEILAALVGTRKEQYKREAATKRSNFSDPSSQQSELTSKLQKMITAGQVINVETKNKEEDKED